MLVFCETSTVSYIFYFIISVRTVSSITEKKSGRNQVQKEILAMATFLANQINSTGAFSSPEAALRLFGQHQESRPLARLNTGSPLSITLRMLSVKFDKSD